MTLRRAFAKCPRCTEPSYRWDARLEEDSCLACGYVKYPAPPKIVIPKRLKGWKRARKRRGR